MAQNDRPTIVLDDDEGRRFHATWSRSGKRLIVTVFKSGHSDAHQQVELRPEQADLLQEFLGQSGPA